MLRSLILAALAALVFPLPAQEHHSVLGRSSTNRVEATWWDSGGSIIASVPVRPDIDTSAISQVDGAHVINVIPMGVDPDGGLRFELVFNDGSTSTYIMRADQNVLIARWKDKRGIEHEVQTPCTRYLTHRACQNAHEAAVEDLVQRYPPAGTGE